MSATAEKGTRSLLLMTEAVRMDPLREFLETLKSHGTARGNLVGLLHVLVGHAIAGPDGSTISNGLSWRQLAAELKRVRWDPADIEELGLDPTVLPPRDRERLWYMAIARAGIDTPEAFAAAKKLGDPIRKLGYQIRSAREKGK